MSLRMHVYKCASIEVYIRKVCMSLRMHVCKCAHIEVHIHILCSRLTLRQYMST